VNDLLVKHFPNIVDFDFTAEMENNLDKVAQGKIKWQPLIKEFYTPFHKNIEKKNMEISKKEITEERTDEKCPNCGRPVVKKLGRYGKFLACSNYPECKYTQNIDEDGTPSKESPVTDEKCDKCGAPMIKRMGKYGSFLGCSKYPECKYIKNTESKTGVKCPKCKEGEFTAKRGRGGKMFYACDGYPKCKNILWGKPTGAKCEKCGELMVYGPKDITKCSNKECK
jgi:DNA topoisomerase-1